MATQKFTAQEIGGWTPALDSLDADKQFVFEGRNYLFDSKGPKSGFGDRYLEPNGFFQTEHVQGIRMKLTGGNVSFTINYDGVFAWNEFKGNWVLIYATHDTSTNPYRWTMVYLEGLVYLCHPVTGILVYDPGTQIIQAHANLASASPSDPIAITECSARLCVMTPTLMAWSNAADGLDFTPALGAAGFQVIQERVSGDPIMITSYAGGVLCWTSGGVMKSDFTGDQVVFRHRSLNTDVRPVNSFCFTRIDNNTTVILDQRGLFKMDDTDRGVLKETIPIPYDETFNEFLLGYIRDNELIQNNRLRLEYDPDSRLLFLSANLRYASNGFDQAFVQYVPLAKWGQFSEFHYGILPFDLNAGVRIGSYYGYCGIDRKFRIWTRAPNREADITWQNHGLYNVYSQTVDKSPQYSEDSTHRILATTAKAHGFDSNGLLGLSRSGLYLPDAGVPSPAVPQGLDSQVVIGAFRPTGPDSVWDTSEVTEVMLRSIPTIDSGVTVEDLALESGTEDMMTDSSSLSEDLGTGVPEYVGVQLRVIGTKDGSNEWMSEVCQIGDQAYNATYYTCSVYGVWHLIEVSALNPGESYHIKGLELTAANGGRL